MSERTFRPTSTGITGQVVAQLAAGRSVRECARSLGLPSAFIEQVANDARRRGLIDIVALDAACSLGSCTPDPDSVVCAACPLSAGRRTGLLRRLGGALRARRNRRATP